VLDAARWTRLWAASRSVAARGDRMPIHVHAYRGRLGGAVGNIPADSDLEALLA